MSRSEPAPLACVRCGKPQSASFAPFCSAGCKDRDLLDWLDERHAIPGEALDNDREHD
nr:DNA gyrase inhibitor YacG [Polymorphobacter sp.]